MGGCSFFVRVEADGERSAEPDRGECNVGGTDVDCNRFVAVRGVDESVEHVLCGGVLLRPIDVVEQGTHDIDCTESDVDRFVQIAPQRRRAAIGLLERGFACGDGPIEDVEDDAAKEVLLVGKMAIQGGDPHSGGSCHGVARRLAAGLEDQFDRCVEESAPVPAGVGSQWMVLGNQVLARTETEYIPPLMRESMK